MHNLSRAEALMGLLPLVEPFGQQRADVLHPTPGSLE
jgi:hypothetical protein